mmetsp:Transcript_9995/g.32776  ORF Transcript_9995/g.32776 Transcript_9995/m.32776 type:complete len:511 (-) Transcript_9995:897-2429(-)
MSGEKLEISEFAFASAWRRAADAGDADDDDVVASSTTTTQVPALELAEPADESCTGLVEAWLDSGGSAVLESAAMEAVQAELARAVGEVVRVYACVHAPEDEALEDTKALGALLSARRMQRSFDRPNLRASAHPLFAALCKPRGVLDRGLARAQVGWPASASALARELAAAVEVGGAISGAWAEGEAVLLSTPLHSQRAIAYGRLVCQMCGRMPRGQRGLRIHAQTAHGVEYEAARVEAESASTLVLGAGGGVAPNLLRRAWGRRAAADSSAQKMLPTPLALARDGHLAALVSLSQMEVCEARDRHGSNALHWGAGGGHLEVCEHLVHRLGFSVHSKQPRTGRTPVHYAARNGHIHVLIFLIDKCGADANAQTHDGTTPLHLCVMQGQRAAAAWLLDSDSARVNLHARNDHGCNAAMWAAMAGDVGLLRWLMARGLDLKIINHNNHSLVHKAAQKGRVACVRFLLAPTPEGAGLGDAAHLACDAEGNDPAKIARAEGHAELADLLEQVTF